MFILILSFGIMLSYSSHSSLFMSFSIFVLFRVNLLLSDKHEFKFRGVMSILNTHFIPIFTWIFSIFMLNNCLNALIVHLYY